MSKQKAPRRNVRYVEGVCTGDVEFSTTDNGTEQVFVKAEIPGEGVHTVILFMSEAAMPYTQEKLRAVGWSGKGKIADQIKGHTCNLCVYEEEYNGEWKPKADFAQSGNGGLKAKNPATASQEAQMQARLEAAAAKNDAPHAPAPVAAVPKADIF